MFSCIPHTQSLRRFETSHRWEFGMWERVMIRESTVCGYEWLEIQLNKIFPSAEELRLYGEILLCFSYQRYRSVGDTGQCNKESYQPGFYDSAAFVPQLNSIGSLNLIHRFIEFRIPRKIIPIHSWHPYVSFDITARDRPHSLLQTTQLIFSSPVRSLEWLSVDLA